MSTQLEPHVRAALAAPFLDGQGVRRLGRALWLYLHIVLEVDQRGLFIRHLAKMVTALGVSEPEAQEWLDRLSKSRLIEVLSPPPFLVIKLRSWSNSNHSEQANPPASSSQNGNLHIEVPVSSSSSAAAAFSKREDGGLGEGEALLRDVLDALGEEADPEEFRALLPRYSPATVRQALRRVETTPVGQIRKSRVALFRYLLDKLS